MAKKTTEEFYKEVKEKGHGEYELVGDYVNAQTHTRIRHLVCGDEYNVKPTYFIAGSRCSKCQHKKANLNARVAISDFYDSLGAETKERYLFFPEDLTQEDKRKVRVQCRRCGTESYVRRDSLKSGRGCSTCNKASYKEKYTLTTESYGNRVKTDTHGDYELVGSYTGVKSRITIHHITCGNQFSTLPYLFNKGRRCPICNSSSLGEEMTRKALSELGITFSEQVSFDDLKDKNRLTYDFYLPDSKSLIEYQGIQHYKPRDLFGGEKAFKVQVKHDALKRAYAEEGGYTLISIPYSIKSIDEIKGFIRDSLPNNSQ